MSLLRKVWSKGLVPQMLIDRGLGVAPGQPACHGGESILPLTVDFPGDSYGHDLAPVGGGGGFCFVWGGGGGGWDEHILPVEFHRVFFGTLNWGSANPR